MRGSKRSYSAHASKRCSKADRQADACVRRPGGRDHHTMRVIAAPKGAFLLAPANPASTLRCVQCRLVRCLEVVQGLLSPPFSLPSSRLRPRRLCTQRTYSIHGSLRRLTAGAWTGERTARDGRARWAIVARAVAPICVHCTLNWVACKPGCETKHADTYRKWRE